MNLSHLKTFQVVAEELNFTRAAMRLNYSQPTITKHIQALEEKLGVLLLDRSGGRYQLTSAGQKLYRSSLKIFNELHVIDRMATTTNNQTMLRLQGHDYYCYHYFLPAINKLRAGFPNIMYKLNSSNNEQTIARLLKNEIDVGIVSGTLLPNDCEAICIGYEEVVICVNHRAYRPNWQIEDYLSKRPLILDQTEIYNTKNILPYVTTPYILLDSDSDETIQKGILEQNMIGIVRSGRIKDEIKKDNIRVLETLNAHDPVYFVYHKSNQNNSVIQAFKEIIQQSAHSRSLNTIKWL